MIKKEHKEEKRYDKKEIEKLKKRRERIIKSLPGFDKILRSTISKYYLTCGNKDCWCYKGKKDIVLTFTYQRQIIKRQKRLIPIKNHNQLLTFLNYPEIEPTNNLAERLLRKNVIMRKITFGNRSEKGAENQCILASVIQTAILNNIKISDIFTSLIYIRQNPTPLKIFTKTYLLPFPFFVIHLPFYYLVTGEVIKCYTIFL